MTKDKNKDERIEELEELNNLKETNEQILEGYKEKKERLTFNFEDTRKELINFVTKELNMNKTFSAKLWNNYDKSVVSKSDHFMFITFNDWKESKIETFVDTSTISLDPMTVKLGGSPTEFYVNENTIEDVAKTIAEQFIENFISIL